MKNLLNSGLWGTGATSLRRMAERIVLAHNLVQAVPWLVGLTGSVAAAVYGTGSSSHLVVSIAAGIATGCTLVLGISLGAWYIGVRKSGWRRISENMNEELVKRDLDSENAAKFRLVLQLIVDLSSHPFTLRGRRSSDAACDLWLRRYVIDNLDTLSPGIRIGVLNWTAGRTTVACEGNLPGVFDRVLPKNAPRDFSECLADLAPSAKRQLLFEDEDAAVAEWLIVISKGELSLDAKAFIGFAAQALAAARGALLVGPPPSSAASDDDDLAIPRS
jgi:hypothetical protein